MASVVVGTDNIDITSIPVAVVKDIERLTKDKLIQKLRTSDDKTSQEIQLTSTLRQSTTLHGQSSSFVVGILNDKSRQLQLRHDLRNSLGTCASWLNQPSMLNLLAYVDFFGLRKWGVKVKLRQHYQHSTSLIVVACSQHQRMCCAALCLLVNPFDFWMT